MSDRVARLEALLRRVLEWTPSLPAESGLLDEIAAALQDEPNGEFERGVQIGKAMESAEGCICRGNWRAIVKDNETLIGQRFEDEHGNEWTFFGVVHSDDDYYYGMHRKGELKLLSCVGSIEGHGFTLNRT